MSDFDIEAAINDPSSFFAKPSEVLTANISEQDKIKILQSWEYDLKNISVAEEENMGDVDESDQHSNTLSEINNILDNLNALDDSGDSKQ